MNSVVITQKKDILNKSFIYTSSSIGWSHWTTFLIISLILTFSSSTNKSFLHSDFKNW